MRRLLTVATLMISLVATPVLAGHQLSPRPTPVASGCVGHGGGVCPLAVAR
jgi:hypothetical protein